MNEIESMLAFTLFLKSVYGKGAVRLKFIWVLSFMFNFHLPRRRTELFGVIVYKFSILLEIRIIEMYTYRQRLML